MAVTLPSVYQDGTATIAANGTVVTGQSTLWVNSVLPGDFFGVHKGYAIRILSVDSNTQLTLANAWPGATQAAAHYEIMLCPDTQRMQETSRQLLQTLSNGTLTSLATAGGGATGDQMAYFTGPGTMALAGLTAVGRDIIDSADVSAAQTALGVSTFIKGLLDDANASAALTTLGVSTFIQTLLNDADQATALATLGAQASLGFTPIQQGGGPNQGVNKLKIGWGNNNGSRLLLQVDNTDFAGVWPIDINGSAAYLAGQSVGTLYAAMGGSRSGTTTGYAILPGGAKYMWGSNVITTNSASFGFVTFPTSFASSRQVVAMSGDHVAGGGFVVVEAATLGTPLNGFNFVPYLNNAPMANSTIRVNWHALGV